MDFSILSVSGFTIENIHLCIHELIEKSFEKKNGLLWFYLCFYLAIVRRAAVKVDERRGESEYVPKIAANRGKKFA